jgi:hypothetical protein
LAVVGKCSVKAHLLPFGSKFNLVIWQRDVYTTFLVGSRGYQNFPLPFWIDPANENALEYIPGPAELNREELERLREEQ